MTVPSLLVEPEELHARLDDPRLVIIDATTFLHMDPEGTDHRLTSGRATYEQEHIPGAVFADLLNDFSDPNAAVPMTVLDSETFAARIGALGVGPDVHVVVYDQGANMWATRLWWNLRLEGFDAVSVLNGGLPAWKAAGYPTRSGVETRPAATFVARRRPELLADRDTVAKAINDENVVLVNALDPATFRGESNAYPRRGRIPSSVNIPFLDLADESGRIRGTDEVRDLFAEKGTLDEGKRVITYCGGGIAATFVAFDLARLGRTDVAVYDGSLNDWTSDPSLPMETG
ncbi:sulfurtransferase [Thermopolyspora flexuosa]|uniref:Thiosulfate/3-mercaptopyruvate sulfurtransferase n=1 Tax=Thermopolyspora flexuosa TaxID=103836 RepID=A0A543IU40_9ACTN|nr:sulfurtransferase [Thermopolyspora flexuosa]TQM74090.1 thiosulfate/3-mercaptopyruvate sulfurtransferase [Thermopolyspora flexuosa]GGM88574.1 sulfurtransferase [Thermopolyspora flexuosa]